METWLFWVWCQLYCLCKVKMAGERSVVLKKHQCTEKNVDEMMWRWCVISGPSHRVCSRVESSSYRCVHRHSWPEWGPSGLLMGTDTGPIWDSSWGCPYWPYVNCPFGFIYCCTVVWRLAPSRGFQVRSPPGAFLCEVCMFFPCMRGLSEYSGFRPKTCMLG